jgi:hypothetical protein
MKFQWISSHVWCTISTNACRRDVLCANQWTAMRLCGFDLCANAWFWANVFKSKIMRNLSDESPKPIERLNAFKNQHHPKYISHSCLEHNAKSKVVMHVAITTLLQTSFIAYASPMPIQWLTARENQHKVLNICVAHHQPSMGHFTTTKQSLSSNHMWKLSAKRQLSKLLNRTLGKGPFRTESTKQGIISRSYARSQFKFIQQTTIYNVHVSFATEARCQFRGWTHSNNKPL